MALLTCRRFTNQRIIIGSHGPVQLDEEGSTTIPDEVAEGLKNISEFEITQPEMPMRTPVETPTTKTNTPEFTPARRKNIRR